MLPAGLGVNDQGEKKLLAVEDGVRESTQSWREVLLGLKARGMNAPELAIGDGAMGFWAAQEEIWPGTRQQRCWVKCCPQHLTNYVALRIMLRRLSKPRPGNVAGRISGT